MQNGTRKGKSIKCVVRVFQKNLKNAILTISMK